MASKSIWSSIAACFTACFKPRKSRTSKRTQPEVTPVVTAYETPAVIPDVVLADQTPMMVSAAEKPSGVLPDLGCGDSTTVKLTPDISPPQPLTLEGHQQDMEAIPAPHQDGIETPQRFPHTSLRIHVLKKNWARTVQQVHQEFSAALPLYHQTEEVMVQANAEIHRSERPDCDWATTPVFPRLSRDWLRKQLLRESFLLEFLKTYHGLQEVLPLYNSAIDGPKPVITDEALADQTLMMVAAAEKPSGALPDLGCGDSAAVSLTPDTSAPQPLMLEGHQHNIEAIPAPHQDGIETPPQRFPRAQHDHLRVHVLKKNWARSVQQVHREFSAALPLYNRTEEVMVQANAEIHRSGRPDCEWPNTTDFPRLSRDWLRKQLLRESFLLEFLKTYHGLQEVLPLYNSAIDGICQDDKSMFDSAPRSQRTY